MDIELLRNFCIAKKGVTESFPFDSDTLVFKVMGKAFVLTGTAHFNSINVKCEPEKAIELRDQYTAVQPGYHMNKKHWNTLMLNDSLTDLFIFEQVDHSYQEVVKGLPVKIRKELGY